MPPLHLSAVFLRLPIDVVFVRLVRPCSLLLAVHDS